MNNNKIQHKPDAHFHHSRCGGFGPDTEISDVTKGLSISNILHRHENTRDISDVHVARRSTLSTLSTVLTTMSCKSPLVVACGEVGHLRCEPARPRRPLADYSLIASQRVVSAQFRYPPHKNTDSFQWVFDDVGRRDRELLSYSILTIRRSTPRHMYLPPTTSSDTQMERRKNPEYKMHYDFPRTARFAVFGMSMGPFVGTSTLWSLD